MIRQSDKPDVQVGSNGRVERTFEIFFTEDAHYTLEYNYVSGSGLEATQITKNETDVDDFIIDTIAPTGKFLMNEILCDMMNPNEDFTFKVFERGQILVTAKANDGNTGDDVTIT